ncbi:MAG: hypothetical protein QOF40_693 [Actinomycetota bacterium]|nr:hypothetical protein [Actinomycetota bacterium]
MYVTRTYRALEHGFRVSVESQPLGAYVDDLFAAFPEGDTSDPVEYTIGIAADGADRWTLDIAGDGESKGEVSTVLMQLMQSLNQRAIESTDALVVHAGGVERDGVGLVLPAHMESGKTTLTTGLVRAGFRYLSDEAIAFDRETGWIEPYPKPFSLDPGSWSMFPELEPSVPGTAPGYDAVQWLVPPGAIRPDAVSGACRARFLVFPKYEAGVATELRGLSRAEATIELARNTFAFREQSRRSLDAVAMIVRDTEVYRMAVGDLQEAVAQLDELVGAAAGASAVASTSADV